MPTKKFRLFGNGSLVGDGAILPNGEAFLYRYDTNRVERYASASALELAYAGYKLVVEESWMR